MSENEIDLEGRLALFPDTASLETDKGCLKIAGWDLEALAEKYGTPLYIYDRKTLDNAVDEYKRAQGCYYPGESGLTYAGKAYLCTAIAQWTQIHGLYLDCTGAGELRIAREGKVERERIVLHGVNKSLEDLQAALEAAGILVVDNLPELDRLRQLCQVSGQKPSSLWLRFRPGLAVETHRLRQTGQENSKFGMSREEICQAVKICLEGDLPVSGIHFHQGSHFHDPAPLGQAISAALDLAVELQAETGWRLETLCPGGGWGIAYHERELPHPPVEHYVRYISEQVQMGCDLRRIPLPRLVLEPGRSLVARAGVALYRVGAVKRTPGRRWLLLDGGLADNPRPALYQAAYSALPAREPQRPSAGPAWLGGPFCESGDILIEGLPLPDIAPGELLAVPVSGAYQLSMGSNYNGARKPAVVLVEEGEARLIQRREELDELVRRDLPLE